jgi:RNA polymerase sigma-70 factor (ECF subfamily)
MDRRDFDQRLSQIVTRWSVLARAHGAEPDAPGAAQASLLQVYGGAVYRYLLGAVRDPDAAADLAQEFAVRFLRGDFRRADPGRGRFRDYLKTALCHLATDHHNARRAAPQALHTDAPAPVWAAVEEGDFLASCRDDLLDRTWNALEASQPLFAAVLRLRVVDPEMTSARMAETVGAQLGRPVTPDLVRKSLQRARERFAQLLLDEVARSLGTDEPEAQEQELRELDLLRYCGAALDRRRKSLPGA